MSNNKKDQGRTAGLAPKLRFREFQNAGAWKRKNLKDVASFYKGKGISRSEVAIDGTLPCIRYGELYTYYGEVIHYVLSKTNTPSKELFLSEANDVIIPSSGESKADIAKASCVLSGGVALGGDLNVIRSTENGVFLSYYMNGALRHKISRVAQGDAVVHLYLSQLEHLELAIPSIQEQKKIAASLSALDEQLAAEMRKLQDLETHKRGLMQQLFPEKGATVSRLRFQEFQHSGEWEIKRLGDCLVERNQSSDKRTPLFSLTLEGGITPKTKRYERSFLVKDEQDAYRLMLQNDFAYNPMNLRFGAIARHAGAINISVSKYYNIFYCNGTVDARFCEIYFRSDAMLAFYGDMAAGSLTEKKRVHFSDFLAFTIRFPSHPEQVKIADCISCLNDWITTQKNKVNSLRTHKQGLLQQLFPVMDEVQS